MGTILATNTNLGTYWIETKLLLKETYPRPNNKHIQHL